MRLPRLVTAVASGAVLLAPLTGCGVLSEQRLDFSHVEEVAITAVTIAPGSGDVVVRTSPVSNVEIKRIVRYRGEEPGSTYRIEGTTLSIDTDCGRRCGVSYQILAPEGVAVSGENGSGDIELSDVGEVRVEVGSGDVTVTGATGAVTARTGSGDVTVTDAAGAVTARTGSGSITGRGLGGSEVLAEAGSGSISLTLDTAAPVSAEASSGDIDLTVPSGGYRVQAEAGSGEVQIGVPDDPAATTLLRLHTGSGDITVSQH